METEVQLIIPTKYGISESNSNVIAKNCIPIIQEFNKLEIDYDSIMSAKEMTSDICKKSKALRNKYVKVRTGGDRVIQDSKTAIKKQVDAHDQLRRDFKETINEREEKLREKELHFEKIEEAKREEIRKERNAELEKYETVYDAGDIALMDDELYKHFLNGIKSDYEAKKEEERKVEEDRIKAKKKQDLFTARKEKLVQFSQFGVYQLLALDSTEKQFIALVKEGEDKKKAFDKKQAEIESENERLKKEAEEKEEKEKELELRNSKRNNELRPYIVFIRDYTALLNSDEKDYQKQLKDIKAGAELQWESDRKEQQRKVAQDKKDLEEKEKLKKEIEEKAEAERKAKQEEELQKYLEAEEARKAELAPAKEKLSKWVNDMTIRGIGTENMNDESIAIANEIFSKFSSFKKWAKSEIEKIK